MTPLEAARLMWDAWCVSWLIAMVWSRRAAARPPAVAQFVHWAPTLLGFFLLGFGSYRTHYRPLWSLSDPVAWVLAGVCAAGLLFTWWARITLGSLWSGSVSRKDDHVVVQKGPYGLVRHPIYTGLIAAALAYGALASMAANLAGAVLIAFGFWLKARLEERFLSQELGEAAYADYRRRIPMLIPFWPARG
ncbi:MAG TPA: isoprenylcysteine carboxylmethyltransferase family protein [Caulobacteraceae bacterium]|nr:isoprenylcysteine carboxylmethyltransferase family protein [Caulobacteraceae bacterium]